MTFSVDQTKQLLAPIKPNRVLSDGKGHSHVSQQDVTAHLIRVFGFGNFSTELLDLTLLYEVCRDDTKPYREQRWDVAYRATMRVTIYRDWDGTDFPPDLEDRTICSFVDSSTGDAQNQVRHDAHDLAMKSAISLAKKRCCINLGDQFGLSLYNKGQMEALVRGTLVLPDGFFDEVAVPAEDITEDVPQQESMGHDEVEKPNGDVEPTPEQAERLSTSVGTRTEPAVEMTDEARSHMESAAADLRGNTPPPADMEVRRREMFALMNEARIIEGIDNVDEQKAARIGYCNSVLDREIASSTEMTYDEVVKVNQSLRALVESEKAGAK